MSGASHQLRQSSLKDNRLLVPIRGGGEPERALVGGKGWRLIRMARRGLPVPDGFVVTTEAFEATMQQALAHAEALDFSHVTRRLAEASLPPVVESVVANAYAELGGPVAVRSSATDEDADAQSLAGQQTTLLGVTGLEHVLDAIREVWASILSREALLYRGRRRLDAPPPAMAVVVQTMVEASSAGVIFTINPVDDNRSELLVNAAFGLGETVVSGQDADTWYVDRDSGEVRARIARKSIQMVSNEEGIHREEVSEALQDAPCLSRQQISALKDKALNIESLFGTAQDIEFAFRSSAPESLRILQARPVTTGRGRRSSTGHAAALFSNANVGEALPGVGTPLTWSIIHSFARRGFETAFGALGLDVPERFKLVASFRGRVYLNISEFVTIASQIPLLDGETLAGLAGVHEVTGLEGTYTRMSPSSFLRRLPVTIPRLAVSQLSMPTVARQWARRFRKRRDAFFARDLPALQRPQLLEALDEVDAVFNRTGEVMLASASNFLMSYVVTTEALQLLGGPKAAEKHGVLFSGLTGVTSAAPGLELLELARDVKRNPPLQRIFREPADATPGEIWNRLRREPGAASFLDKLDGFLERWGHRAPREAEIATPRWREDPGFLIGVIRQHLMAPRLPTAEQIEREQAAQREDATQVIRQHFFTGLGLFFRGLLRWAQHNARQREELRAYVVDTLSMYRHFCLEVGRRMVDAGQLATRDDVFFLTYGEVRSWLTGKGDIEQEGRWRVAFRRSQFEVFATSPDPPDTFVLVHDQQVPEAQLEEEDAEVLHGLPGAPGRVTGVARVIRDLNAGAPPLQPGEILVAPFTDVGWTPLFLVAGGVVADRGGTLSHSCVVAREYGIPAVVGVTGATQRIRTGDVITVDGQAGRIYLTSSGE